MQEVMVSKMVNIWKTWKITYSKQKRKLLKGEENENEAKLN